jgi:hypothetical protein
VAYREQWVLGVSAASALGLLLLTVIVDLWEERGARYFLVLLSAACWALVGWYLGATIGGIPAFSLSLGPLVVQGTYGALAAAAPGFALGWPLHLKNFS